LRLLILADGGYGKTTFLKHSAQETASTTTLYPLYVSLRDCKREDVLKNYIGERHPGLLKLPATDYKHICFFLDGLDEIGDTGNAVKQLNDFSRIYQDSHILLTCRSNAYFDQLADFSPVRLIAITEEDIETYISKVYTNSNTPVNPAELLSSIFRVL